MLDWGARQRQNFGVRWRTQGHGQKSEEMERLLMRSKVVDRRVR
jgi:hypothetical protein